jgi:amino acid transporter
MVAESVDRLQQQLQEQAVGEKKFGTFTGVFTPTLLTILGVIMYLREGWVVGNAGLLGAWLVILLACSITVLTGLSMSSITTNIRIGAGGAFSIISQSLGLEAGGSLGIPLYLAQAFAVTMYIFGFREGWIWIFPTHSAIVVDLVTFLVIFAVAWLSAGVAFRVQFGIMAIVALSLGSVLWAAFQGSMTHPIAWWGPFSVSTRGAVSGAGFWYIFAVFFPAATGIMAGANMSGELRNPRRNIPVGTLSAIAVSTVVYLVVAYWLARSASPRELVDNYTILIDRAAWRPLVLAGLLGATFSSALSSFVGAPRILAALGQHRILPAAEWFARRSHSGEPRNGMMVTGAIGLCALLVRDLNAIAPLITMFFLITYAMINAVVLTEQTLGLVSFRPTFRVPRVVPLLGTVGCFYAMFLLNPAFSLAAVVFVVLLYGVLLRRSLQAPFGDVRSGLFGAVAEWAARKVADLPAAHERAWQPNLVVPVESARELRGSFRFLYSLARPKGSIKILGMNSSGEASRMEAQLPRLTGTFRKQGVFASWTTMDVPAFAQGVLGGIQALRGAILRPNICFLTLSKASEREADLQEIIAKSRSSQVGVLLFARHPAAGLGLEKSINLWVSDRSPDWPITMDLGNLDICLLIAYLLKRNWDAELTMITVVEQAEQLANAEAFLGRLAELARLPKGTKRTALVGTFQDSLSTVPPADLNVIGMPGEVNLDDIRRTVDLSRASCAFVLASGQESALA